MIKQSKGKIFLADERGLNEADWFRSWNTFNFGRYYNEYKHPLGDIYVFNDDLLAGGRSLKMLAEESSYVLVLPISGAINCKDQTAQETLLAAGQLQVLSVEKGKTIEFSNPFREETVNFLQIWLKGIDIPDINSAGCDFDVNRFQNCLMKVSPQRVEDNRLPFSASIGKFTGRGETIFYPQEKEAPVFLFVIEGAFEVAGRLLHARDALALWDSGELELEALSNDALILVIEQGLPSLQV
jgi:quercetin 2,3-dioxygenase